MRAAAAVLLLACALPAAGGRALRAAHPEMGGHPGDQLVPTPLPTPAPTPGPGAAATAPPARSTLSPVASESPLNSLGCPAPASVAAVTYTGGTASPIPITAPTADWYTGHKLGLPADSAWLECATLYRLGGIPLLPRGSSATVSCRAEACDVYVFHYHQPPYSGGSNGNLPQTLPGAGFNGKSCAPEFAPSAAPACWYPTMMYRKQLAGAQSDVTVEIDTGVDAMYTGIIVVKGTDCSANERGASQAACEAPAEPGAVHLCRWQSGACAAQWCEKTPAGGSSGGASSGGAASGGATSGGSGGGCPPSPLQF